MLNVYEFLEGGVLEVRPTEDSGKSRTYYAPHKWELISADHNHKPGSAGGNYDVRRSVL